MSAKPKIIGKVKIRLSRHGGHRTEIDADLAERGIALSDMYIAYLSGGESAVPGLAAILDAFIVSRARPPEGAS